MTEFSIFEKQTGKHLATLPLTMPIHFALKAYEDAGYKVMWSWAETEKENS